MPLKARQPKLPLATYQSTARTTTPQNPGANRTVPTSRSFAALPLQRQNGWVIKRNSIQKLLQPLIDLAQIGVACLVFAAFGVVLLAAMSTILLASHWLFDPDAHLADKA